MNKIKLYQLGISLFFTLIWSGILFLSFTDILEIYGKNDVSVPWNRDKNIPLTDLPSSYGSLMIRISAERVPSVVIFTFSFGATLLLLSSSVITFRELRRKPM
jgi:hypothetical protein